MPISVLGGSGYAVMARDLALADGSAAAPTLSADGSTISGNWSGGDGAFVTTGTFGGGTLTLQWQAPDGTWLSLGSGAALTAAGMAGFTAPAGLLRATLAGSAGPSVKAWTRGLAVISAG